MGPVFIRGNTACTLPISPESGAKTFFEAIVCIGAANSNFGKISFQDQVVDKENINLIISCPQEQLRN